MFAVCKRVNGIMRDTSEETKHMDLCQGKALFEVLNGYNPLSARGRSDIFKLLFDKKSGAIGGIYDDMENFENIYPNELTIFKNGLPHLHGYNSFYEKRPPQMTF